MELFLYTYEVQQATTRHTKSKEDYIKEHFSKYKDSAFPPAWKAMELLSLGTLAKLIFNASDNKVKKKIAREFGFAKAVA